MGLPFEAAEECEHVFVRLAGALDLADAPSLTATTCSHCDIDGVDVTEALVSGFGVRRHLERALAGRDVRALTAVTCPDWIAQSVAAAANPRQQEWAGALTVLALRAPEAERHLVSHPRALSAPMLLANLARCLDRLLCTA